MVIFIISTFFLVKKFQIPRDQKNAKVQSKATGALADPITNAVTIKMFARKKHEDRKFSSAVYESFKFRKKAWYTHVWISVFQSTMITIIQALIFFLMIKMWTVGTITAGTIVLIQLYITQIYVDLLGFGNVIKDWNQSIADAKEMTDILKSLSGSNSLALRRRLQH